MADKVEPAMILSFDMTVVVNCAGSEKRRILQIHGFLLGIEKQKNGDFEKRSLFKEDVQRTRRYSLGTPQTSGSNRYGVNITSVGARHLLYAPGWWANQCPLPSQAHLVVVAPHHIAICGVPAFLRHSADQTPTTRATRAGREAQLEPAMVNVSPFPSHGL